MMSRSLMKRRFDGEMSTVPSAPMGVCSPPVPLTERPSGLQTALALFSVPSAVKLGILTCVEIKILRRVHRVDLHAIDATPAQWRGDAGSSPLDRARAPDTRADFHTGEYWVLATQIGKFPKPWAS